MIPNLTREIPRPVAHDGPDLEMGVRGREQRPVGDPAREDVSGSEGSVTSPIGVAPEMPPRPAATTMEQLRAEGSQRQARSGRSEAGPRPQSQPNSSERHAPAAAVPAATAAPTFREQCVRVPREREEVSRFARTRALKSAAVLLPTGGGTAGLAYGLNSAVSGFTITFSLVFGVAFIMFATTMIARNWRLVKQFARGDLTPPRLANIQALRLDKEIEFWTELPDSPVKPQTWHADRSDGARCFALFLGRLGQNKDYANDKMRPFLAQRLENLFELMTGSERLRSRMFAIAERESVGNRHPVLVLFNMEGEAENYLARKDRPILTEPRIFRLGRAKFRMKQLEEFVEMRFARARPAADGSLEAAKENTLLYLYSKLRVPLVLAVSRFHHPPPGFKPKPDLLERARSWVESADQREIVTARKNWRDGLAILREGRLQPLPEFKGPKEALFLATYTPWREFVEDSDKERIARLKADIEAHQKRLDAWLNPAAAQGASEGSISPLQEDWRARAEFYAQYGPAFNRAVKYLAELSKS